MVLVWLKLTLLLTLKLYCMTKDFIVRSLSEDEYSFYLSDGKEEMLLRKKDLGKIRPKVKDQVVVVLYPNFPHVVAALDLNGKRIFSKSRKNVIDEYLGYQEDQLMYQRLPLIAKERVKMFSSMEENFLPSDRLREVVALSLSYRLFEHCNRSEQPENKIEAFGKLSISEQIKELPMFWHPLLPQIKPNVIVDFAKAFLHDHQSGLTGVDKNDLLKSEIMKQPNATAEGYGNFCEPRIDYIEQYLELP